MHTVLRSASKEVVVGEDQPFCIVGERINPTGRKLFQEQLRAGDLSRIELDVAQQIAGGAMVLDVNMGAPLADEVGLMVEAIKLVQSLTDLPVCIDSSVIEALEAGLSTYQGKALVNSVTAEDGRLEAILPLVKRYGAAVIALPNDEFEIQNSRRVASSSPARSSRWRLAGTISPSRTSSWILWRCQSAPIHRSSSRPSRPCLSFATSSA